MVFRYRLIKSNRLLFKKYILKIICTVIIIFIIWIIYQSWIISQLSKLNDMSISMSDELNLALIDIENIDEHKDTWRKPDIEGTRIFSAYLDTRPEVVLYENRNLFVDNTSWGLIRIIAILPLYLENSQLTCYFKYKYKNSSFSYIVKKNFLRIVPIAVRENFDMYYSAAYILCPLPFNNILDKSILKLPHEITVSINSNRDVKKIKKDEFITIRYPKKLKDNLIVNNKNNFSICVQPFHHNFDKKIELISFIEYYMLMGVTRLTFYRDSVTNDIDKIFDYYKKKNLAIILEWKLPDIYIFERTLRVDGIYAALNDCLYRSANYLDYKYVIGVDIDEYIVPRIHDNFLQMMEHLDNDDLNGAWIFRNVFYYLMYDDDPITLPPELPELDVHRKTKRWVETNRRNDRSKFIVKGKKVVELGNHRIWEMMRLFSIFQRRYQEVEVDPKIGTSNHYRNCETVIEKCWQKKTIIDRTIHRFTLELSKRVLAVEKEIFKS
ncbi:uncharacterized protein LOC122857404 [Aphidius gifuensis]|uniref:uncharacterized protein LOC122857404 n=1 Tax=Aphidius gifuensis TaxID=684658 RepID=UPI001CDD6B96|nr:uncharacterized protein LOC122857404 [Aphidius gifuensis]